MAAVRYVKLFNNRTKQLAQMYIIHQCMNNAADHAGTRIEDPINNTVDSFLIHLERRL